MKEFNTLVSCHDLGGANQIIYSFLGSDSAYVLTGPAVQVAAKLELRNVIQRQSVDLSKFNQLVVASNSEFQFSDKLLVEAKFLGLPTVGYLDHWVNYKKRWFALPDKIIVTDWYAFFNAFFTFGFKVRLRPNYYLRFLEEQSTSIRNQVNATQALFLIQPIQKVYFHDDFADACFCKYVDLFISKNRISHILIRDHATTDSDDCLDSLRKKHETIFFSKTDWTHPLERDIFQSEYVIGYDTYALYVAKKLGKRVRAIDKRRAWVSPIYRRI
jgi:hypothetical protein